MQDVSVSAAVRKMQSVAARFFIVLMVVGLFEGCSINYGIRNVQKKVLTVLVATK